MFQDDCDLPLLILFIGSLRDVKENMLVEVWGNTGRRDMLIRSSPLLAYVEVDKRYAHTAKFTTPPAGIGVLVHVLSDFPPRVLWRGPLGSDLQHADGVHAC